MNKVRVGIIGASGYSGEELLKLLLRHSGVEISFVTSRQHAGKSLAQVFPKFASHPLAKKLKFIEPSSDELIDLLGKKKSSSVVFLALPHGVAAEYAKPLLEAKVRVIDLSADFRLRDANVYHEFYKHIHPAPELLKKAVYGLVEIKRSLIRKSAFIASPGCYPTSVLLPLIPLLKARLVQPDGIVVNSMSGVSGAGRKAEEAYLFCECNESVRAYGVPKHRHISEIEQELNEASGKKSFIQFTPHLMPVNRGIFTSICVKPVKNRSDIHHDISECYENVYGSEPFVRILTGSIPDTKNVVGTNVIEISHVHDPRTGNVMIYSAIDNLFKGASGQAIQSMNIMFGLPETESLL